MNSIMSLLVGPLGEAFSVIDEYRFLPNPECFTEFTEEMYEAYFNKMGMPAERMYQMNPGAHYKGTEILIVSKTEMGEMLKARRFIDDVIKEETSLEGASDEERLDYFKSIYSFLFPDQKNENK